MDLYTCIYLFLFKKQIDIILSFPVRCNSNILIKYFSQHTDRNFIQYHQYRWNISNNRQTEACCTEQMETAREMSYKMIKQVACADWSSLSFSDSLCSTFMNAYLIVCGMVRMSDRSHTMWWRYVYIPCFLQIFHFACPGDSFLYRSVYVNH